MVPNAVAVERFDLRDFAPEARSEAWRDVLAATHLPWNSPPQATESAACDVWVRHVRFEDSVLVDCACDPCRGTRGRHEISATDGEFVAVLINLAGREVLEQDGRAAELTPGELTVWDSRRPAAFVVLEPLRKRTLFVPRAELAARCSRFDDMTAVGLVRRGPAARLLTSYLAMLAPLLPSLDAPALEGARNAAVDLLCAALRPEASISELSLRAGVHALAVEYAERHLGDPGLTPGRVAARLGVSLRSLQLAFQEQGDSVAAHVRRRRLARSHAELSRRADVPITEVAFRWGFVDSGHFARLFRREYGLTPSELRDRAREPVQPLSHLRE